MGNTGRAFAVPMLCGLIGVVLAIAVQLLVNGGIVLDEFLSDTLLLREVQALIIIVWLGVGVLISATQ